MASLPAGVIARDAAAQNERLPLLLKTFTCVTVRTPGPTQEIALLLGFPIVFQLVVTV